jgi:hypothetical protein
MRVSREKRTPHRIARGTDIWAGEKKIIFCEIKLIIMYGTVKK